MRIRRFAVNEIIRAMRRRMEAIEAPRIFQRIVIARPCPEFEETHPTTLVT